MEIYTVFLVYTHKSCGRGIVPIWPNYPMIVAYLKIYSSLKNMQLWWYRGVPLILDHNFSFNIFDRGHHQEFISLLRNDKNSPSLLLRYIVSHVAKTAIFYSSAIFRMWFLENHFNFKILASDQNLRPKITWNLENS